MAARAHDRSIRREDLTEEWDTGFCSCCSNLGNCCDTLWCPWCVLCKQFDHVVIASEDGLREPGSGNCYACFCPCYASVLIRTQVVTKYKINDLGCWKAFCCIGLSTCQVQRQLELKGEFPGGMCCEREPALCPPQETAPMGDCASTSCSGRHSPRPQSRSRPSRATMHSAQGRRSQTPGLGRKPRSLSASAKRSPASPAQPVMTEVEVIGTPGQIGDE